MYSYLTREVGINDRNVKYLIRLIDTHGFGVLRRGFNKYYSIEFKEAAIKRVLIEGTRINQQWKYF